jgi:hypothetical protein
VTSDCSTLGKPLQSAGGTGEAEPNCRYRIHSGNCQPLRRAALSLFNLHGPSGSNASSRVPQKQPRILHCVQEDSALDQIGIFRNRDYASAFSENLFDGRDEAGNVVRNGFSRWLPTEFAQRLARNRSD